MNKHTAKNPLEILDYLNDAVFIHTYDGMILEVSKKACEYSGYTKEELKQIKVQDLDTPEYAARIPDRMEEFKQKSSLVFESAHRRKDGIIVPVEVSIHSFSYNNTNCIISVVRDISIRKKTENMLRENEEKFKAITDNMADIAFTMDLQFTMRYISAAVKKVIGYSQDEYLQLPLKEQFPPETLEIMFEILHEELENEEKPGIDPERTRTIDIQALKKDGSLTDLSVHAKFLRDESGKPVAIIGVARDITECKQLEKNLQESKERLKAITNNMADIAWIVNLQFKTEYISPSVEKVLGFTVEEYLTRKIEEKYPPEVLKNIVFILYEELENDKKSDVDKNRTRIVEVQEYKKDGTLADLSVHVKFLRDQAGNPTGIIGVSRDITKQKKAEKEIQRLSNIVEQSLNEIYIFDAKTLMFTYINQAARNNLGYSFEELKHMTPVDIKPEFTMQQFKELLQPLRDGAEKSIVFETVHRRKNGSTYAVEVHVQLMRIENEKYFVAIILDISERKRIEKSLKESEEKFRILAESTPMTIMMYQDNKWIYANPAAEALLEYSEQELCSMNFWDFVHPDDKAIVIERGSKRQKGEDATVGYEFRVISKSGMIKWVLLYGATVMYKGKPAGLISVLDITERKKIEEEKRKLQEQLLQSQKMESIGTLAGGVAHEFNNMLNIISGHAELALLNIPQENDARKDIEEIKKAAQRSAEITKKLLTFARKQEEKSSIINVNATIDAMIGMLKRLIGENIQLVWQPANRELSVNLDEVSLDHILVNLSVNARDAIDKQGTITISTHSVLIDDQVSLQHNALPGEYALIQVTDDGIGIDEETQKLIFDPFFTTKEVGKGTGLGLSTVYGIVKNNGGFIEVQSEKEKGTTFKIYLPVFIERRKFAQYHDNAVKDLFHGTETILIVEDEVSILKMIKKMLEILGYTVLEAGDPFEGLEIVKNYIGTIHLLITDVVMPKMNGVDLAKLVSAIYPQIKILYTSGYSAEVLLKHNIKASDINYLSKPVSFASLASTVRTILDN